MSCARRCEACSRARKRPCRRAARRSSRSTRRPLVVVSSMSHGDGHRPDDIGSALRTVIQSAQRFALRPRPPPCRRRYNPPFGFAPSTSVLGYTARFGLLDASRDSSHGWRRGRSVRARKPHTQRQANDRIDRTSSPRPRERIFGSDRPRLIARLRSCHSVDMLCRRLVHWPDRPASR